MNDVSSYATRGPYPVGVRTLQVATDENRERALPADVWYPAAAQWSGRDIDPADDAGHPFGARHTAVLNATPANDRFPLLLFSHGNSGLRQQSTFLTTHLASWGFVVAAPDHVGNTFAEMFNLDEEQRKAVHRAARRNRPTDLQAVIRTLAGGGADLPSVRLDRIGVIGHSFGGWTAMKMPAREARVQAVCGLAPASEPFVGRSAFAEGELPFAGEVATLLIAGADDCLVDLDTSIEPLYARLSSPRALVVIDDMDHFHFCDSIKLIHDNHVRTPRPGLRRAVRPYRDLLPEARAHRIVRALATGFLHARLSQDRDAMAVLSTAADVDPAVRPPRGLA